jgi:hypothetical protein
MAKSTYEAFLLVFPASYDILKKGLFKKEVYKDVLLLLVGEDFSFEFHLEMLKELFGDSEVKGTKKEIVLEIQW